jgi:hypothetical protein
VCRFQEIKLGFQAPLGLGLRNPKTFKISYKGNDLFPTSQREREEKAREKQ